MKRKTKRTTDRWSDRPQSGETATPYVDSSRASREAARPVVAQKGLGPYEARYDVSLGYSHDRAIILP